MGGAVMPATPQASKRVLMLTYAACPVRWMLSPSRLMVGLVDAHAFQASLRAAVRDCQPCEVVVMRAFAARA